MKKMFLATTLLMSSGFIFANEQAHEHEATHEMMMEQMEQMEQIEDIDSELLEDEALEENVKQHEHKAKHSHTKMPVEPMNKEPRGLDNEVSEKTHDHMKMK